MDIVILKALISGFLASLGFGILFNIRGKKLIYAGLTGAVGAILYKWSLCLGGSELMANFIGALGLSLCGEILARVCKSPVITFEACALIPLVPGGGMYRTMFEIIQGNAEQALSIGLETLSIAGVLALGVLVVSTCMRSYFRLKRIYERSRGLI